MPGCEDGTFPTIQFCLRLVARWLYSWLRLAISQIYTGDWLRPHFTQFSSVYWKEMFCPLGHDITFRYECCKGPVQQYHKKRQTRQKRSWRNNKKTGDEKNVTWRGMGFGLSFRIHTGTTTHTVDNLSLNTAHPNYIWGGVSFCPPSTELSSTAQNK